MCSVCITVNVRLFGFSNCLSLVAPTWPLTIVEEEWKKKCVRLVVMNFRLGTFCFCALLRSHSLSLAPLSLFRSLSLTLYRTHSLILSQTDSCLLSTHVYKKSSQSSFGQFSASLRKKEIRAEKTLFRILSGFPDWELSSTFIKKIFKKSVQAIKNQEKTFLRFYDFTIFVKNL